jgi:hypothetical protein
MASGGKINLKGTTSESFQIGLNGVTIDSGAVVEKYSLQLPERLGNVDESLVLGTNGNLTFSHTKKLVGDDSNVVINANGSISVGINGQGDVLVIDGDGSTANLKMVGSSDLGSVSDVKIGGGSADYIMTTDGSGNLDFRSADSLLSVPTIPKIAFVVTTDGNSQSFVSEDLTLYGNTVVPTVYRNGVFVDDTNYAITGNTITFNHWLRVDEEIDIAPSQTKFMTGVGDGTVKRVATAGSGLGFSLTGGPITSNGTVTLNVPTAATLKTTLGVPTVGNIASLDLDGNVSNVLAGDGTWIQAAQGGGGANVAGAVGDLQFNGGGDLAATSGINYDSTGDILTISSNLSLNTDVLASGDILPSVTNTYSLGNSTHRWKDVFVSSNSVVIGDATISSSGNGIAVSSITGNISGDGSALSNIAGSNVVGNVASSVVAYSVDGANVVGAVTDAMFAEASNVAAVANTVAVANVIGIGNIATINLDGNVGNLLTGAGTFVAIPTGGGSGTPGGNSGELQFNSSGSFAGSNKLKYDGNSVIAFSEGSTTPIAGIRVSNSFSGGIATGRARGTYAAPLPLAVNDSFGTVSMLPYTGNGNVTYGGVTGFCGITSGIAAQVIALPSADTLPPSTRLNLFVTDNTSTSTKFVMSADSSNITIGLGLSNINLGGVGTSNISSQTITLGGGGGNTLFRIGSEAGSNNRTQLRGTTAPVNSTDSGLPGEIAFDDDYIYYYTSTGWKRSPLTTW